MDDTRLLIVRIGMESLITEREAMIAENYYRASCGNSPAYSEDSFMIVKSKFTELIEAIKKEAANAA